MLFTFDSYRRLLDLIADSGYAIYGIERILIARRDGDLPRGNFVAVRHDVDYFPKRAMTMATIESERKIAVTYYIRRRFFDTDPDLIGKIRGLGHQIGYHYEEIDIHQKAPGRQIAKSAVAYFIGSLLDIDKLGFPIRSVCAHGNPLTDVDNRQVVHLLRDQTYLDQVAAEYDRAEIKEKISDRLIGDASIDVTGDDFDLYIPDTGRFNPKYNLKDRIDGCPIAGLSSLSDLRSILTGGKYPRVYMNMHPDRWSGNVATWLFDFAFDAAKNMLKRFMGKTGYQGKLIGAKAQKHHHSTSQSQGDKPDGGPGPHS
jgi:hypothetical protein